MSELTERTLDLNRLQPDTLKGYTLDSKRQVKLLISDSPEKATLTMVTGYSNNLADILETFRHQLTPPLLVRMNKMGLISAQGLGRNTYGMIQTLRGTYAYNTEFAQYDPKTQQVDYLTLDEVLERINTQRLMIERGLIDEYSRLRKQMFRGSEVYHGLNVHIPEEDLKRRFI